jgi:hypothetical protein
MSDSELRAVAARFTARRVGMKASTMMHSTAVMMISTIPGRVIFFSG